MKTSIKSAVIALGFFCLSAQAQIAVVTGADGPTITKEQLANVYLGRSKDFKPLDLPEGNAIREAFYRKSTDRDIAQIKAVWARVIFSGQGKPPVIVPDASAVKKALGADQQAVGYIPKSEVDGSVKVLMTLD